MWNSKLVLATMTRVVGVGGPARCRWLGARSLVVGWTARSDCSRVVRVGGPARCWWLGAGSLLVCWTARSDGPRVVGVSVGQTMLGALCGECDANACSARLQVCLSRAQFHTGDNIIVLPGVQGRRWNRASPSCVWRSPPTSS